MKRELNPEPEEDGTFWTSFKEFIEACKVHTLHINKDFRGQKSLMSASPNKIPQEMRSKVILGSQDRQLDRVMNFLLGLGIAQN